jgi:hypothetical protein
LVDCWGRAPKRRRPRTLRLRRSTPSTRRSPHSSSNIEQSRTDFAPYLSTGTSALGSLGDLIGTNGNDKWSAALAQLQQSPLYQSLFRNGQETLAPERQRDGRAAGAAI